MTLQKRIRILLADDDAVLLGATAEFLAGLEVAAKVSDGQALVDAALRLDPDIIITDITMPILDGIQAVKKLQAAGTRAKIIFLTVHADPDFVSECLEAGALGYVEKNRLMTDLIPAIEAARNGQVFVSPSISMQR